MKPIPMAAYLNQFEKIGSIEPNASRRESVLLKPRVVATRQDIDARIAGAFERGKQEGAAVARADSAQAQAQEEADLIERLQQERLAFRASEYAELAEQISKGLSEIEDRIAASVARILRSYLIQEQSKRVAQALSDNLARMLSAELAPVLKIRGPEQLLNMLRERLTMYSIAVEYSAETGIDVTVETQHTLIKSQLKPWIDHIESIDE